MIPRKCSLTPSVLSQIISQREKLLKKTKHALNFVGKPFKLFILNSINILIMKSDLLWSFKFYFVECHWQWTWRLLFFVSFCRNQIEIWWNFSRASEDLEDWHVIRNHLFAFVMILVEIAMEIYSFNGPRFQSSKRHLRTLVPLTIINILNK